MATVISVFLRPLRGRESDAILNDVFGNIEQLVEVSTSVFDTPAHWQINKQMLAALEQELSNVSVIHFGLKGRERA